MTRPRRWSTRVEGQRAGTEAAAARAEQLHDCALTKLARARDLLRTNPDLADKLITEGQLAISQARTLQERIQRFMLEARVGLE